MAENRKYIIIVNNDVVTSECWGERLAGQGYEVYVFGRPAVGELLAYIDNPQFRPAAVVISQWMPAGELSPNQDDDKWTGVLLYQRFRKAFPDIPVIFINEFPVTDLMPRIGRPEKLFFIDMLECTPINLLALIKQVVG